MDQTAPLVTLSAPTTTTTSQNPILRVTAGDAVGLASPATVTLLVYDSSGTTLLHTVTSAATLSGGTATFVLSYALTPGTTYILKAQVNDLAGNTGLSSGQSVQITTNTSYSWNTDPILTSDPLQGDAALQLGDVHTSHPVNLDLSGGSQSGGAALVYNSDTVGVKPIIEASFATANNASLPASITATLNWNGVAVGGTFTYSTSGDHPGDVLNVAAQVPTAVTTTGRYPWTLSVQVAGQPTHSFAGRRLCRRAGCQPLRRRLDLRAGRSALRHPHRRQRAGRQAALFGTGEWRFYQGTSTFASPAGDFGVLAVSGSGWTYTNPDGTVQTFNAAGYESQWTSADAQETLQYRYDGSNRLTGMTTVDGGLSTFSYSLMSGVLSTIQAPGGRTYTFAYNTFPAKTLTLVTDPDGGVDRLTYNASQRLTDQVFSVLQNSWTYGAGDVLSNFNWGRIGAGASVTPAAAAALSVAVAGTLHATSTDAEGDATTVQMDLQGRRLRQVNADGGVETWARDGATTQATALTDPMGRTAAYAYDSLGYVTQQTQADGSTLSWQYQALDHLATSATDELGRTTTYAYDGSGHRTSTTDALGNATAQAYSSSGLPTSVTDADGHTTAYAYDASRRLTSVTDALSHVTTFAYDTRGGATSTTDALGRVTTSSYDGMVCVTSTTDALAGVTAHRWDPTGLFSSVTDPLGRTSQLAYDGRGQTVMQTDGANTPVVRTGVKGYDLAGRVTTTRDAGGSLTRYALDAMGRTTRTTDALGGATLARYDLDGELLAARDAVGNWTAYAYNLRGWATTVTDTLSGVTTTAYDLHGDATAVTDPLGHTTAYAYDALYRVTAVTDALTHTYTTTFDPAGNVLTTTDANGRTTSYAYDALNRATITTTAVGTSAQATSSVAYDAVGNVTSRTDALGHTTAYQYDALNRATVSVDALGHRTTTAFDASGAATTVTDALGQRGTMAYDGLNRLLQSVDPLGHSTWTIRDAMDNVAATIDALDNFTQNAFDALHRQVLSVAMNGAVVKTGYDAASGVTAVTDGVGNKTSYLNDPLGRVTVTTDPLGNKTTTTYDAAGRTSTVTDADGREHLFHYDNGDRLTAVTWLSALGATVNLLTYTYDNNGNQLTAGDYNGAYTNAYDAQNRLTTQTNPYGQTLTYSYDARSRLTERDDSLGGTLTYGYDNADRLTCEQFGGTSQTPLRADFGYNNRNEQTTLTRYSDLAGTTVVGTTAYAYDAAGRTTSITKKNASAATLSYYNYAYDNADRVTAESWQSTTATGTLSGTNTYAYDGANQLTSDGPTAYSYDLAGNRTMAGYATGTGNRLNTDGVWTYTYDAVGDMTQKSKGSGLETWYYGYDTLNRLTTVERTSNGATALLTATYTYDVYNNLIATNEWVTGGTATLTRYDYDGNNEWAETDGSNTVQVRDLYGPGGILARTVSAGLTNAGAGWYFADRLGSTTDIIGPTSPTYVLTHASYDGYGNETDTSVSVVDQHGYAAGFTDRLVQFDHFGARWYNPATGERSSPDPSGLGPDSNPYRYVGNGPTDGTDPRAAHIKRCGA